MEQTQTLKNNFGLIFPPPTAIARKSAAENVFELESSHWAKMLEVLLEFKRKHGHTYVTTFSATEEFNNWVVEQRKKMRALDKHGPYGGCIKNDKAFHDSQAEILKGIGFIYKKQDCDWMENYERLIGEQTMFFFVGAFSLHLSQLIVPSLCDSFSFSFSAYKRLFGISAVSNKFTAFDELAKV